MALNRDWQLAEQVALPNFGNTCYSLTFWKRSQVRGDWPLKCATCGKAFNGAQGDKKVLRCRQTRAVLACDRKCAQDPAC